MVVNTNTNTRRIRTAVALGAAVTLTLAACGGDDDDAADEPAATEAPADEPAAEPAEEPAAKPADDEVPMQPSSITFDAQESNGSMITVGSVDLPAAGFIAVHSDGGGSPGPVIGVSDLLPAGTSTDVMVMLSTPIDADTTLFPMVHIDTDGNGVYEFGAVEGVDGPGVTAEGEVAVVGAAVTLAAADEASAPVEGDAITISDFAFSGVAEVAVGTTVTVTNDDGSPHTWTAVDGTFDSGGLGQGESFEFTFTEAGTYEYFCSIHPSMTGTIVVTG